MHRDVLSGVHMHHPLILVAAGFVQNSDGSGAEKEHACRPLRVSSPPAMRPFRTIWSVVSWILLHLVHTQIIWIDDW